VVIQLLFLQLSHAPPPPYHPCPPLTTSYPLYSFVHTYVWLTHVCGSQKK